MIKTHRPRGHFWTHASAFQQTKEFRDINYDECLAPATRTLVKDPDDKLSQVERAAKRRRIEKLADDFLNGIPLFISSARPCPQSLEHPVAQNRKSSKDTNRVLNKPTQDYDNALSSSLWEDRENDYEILQRLKSEVRSGKHASSDYQIPKGHEVVSSEPVAILNAQASCKPVIRRRPVKLSADPSDEALKQAAALRARRGLRANSEVPVVHTRSSDVGRDEQDVPDPQSEPRDTATCLADMKRSETWLSRRKSRFSFSQYAGNDDSEDELRLSRIETPSTPSQTLRHTEIPPRDGERMVTVQTLPESSEVQSAQRKALTCTTHQQPDVERELPGSSNQRQSCPEVGAMVDHGTDAAPLLQDAVNLSSANRREFDQHKSAGNENPKPSPVARRTRSATTRDLQRVKQGEAAHYQSAPSSPNGSTPFIFRKRSAKAHDGKTKQTESAARNGLKSKRRISSPLPNSTNVADETLSTEARSNCILTEPPVLDLSFNHDSAFARSLNQALVEEQGKDDQIAQISTTPEGNPPTSSRGETHRPTSRPSSSQALGDSSVSPAKPPVNLSETWAGTQYLLDKAQQELFLSPEKQPPASNRAASITPRPSGGLFSTMPRSNKREALKELSQEPMPSTQQLLGNFEGWSTVKKPRAQLRPSLLPTPSAKATSASPSCDELSLTRLTCSAPDRTALHGFDQQRDSSRLSISSTAPSHGNKPSLSQPPPQSSAEAKRAIYFLSSAPASGASRGQGNIRSQPELRSVLRTSGLATGDEATFSELSFAPPFTSFEAAQRSALSREPSDLSETIDEMRSLLDITQDGFNLSQVG